MVEGERVRVVWVRVGGNGNGSGCVDVVVG